MYRRTKIQAHYYIANVLNIPRQILSASVKSSKMCFFLCYVMLMEHNVISLDHFRPTISLTVDIRDQKQSFDQINIHYKWFLLNTIRVLPPCFVINLLPTIFSWLDFVLILVLSTIDGIDTNQSFWATNCNLKGISGM